VVTAATKAMTLSEKVWERHVVRRVEGEPDLLYIDLHLVHEVTSPQAFDSLRMHGRTVRRPDLTVSTIDHNNPTTGPGGPPPDAELDAFVDRLVEAQAAGLAKNIGVSNFPTAPMRRAASRSSVRLINNQVEFHALIDQSKVMAEAQQLGMTLSAYCPLGRGMVLKEPVILGIAKKHGRPPSEIALRWIVQQGVAAIPMTTKRDNAASNFRALCFSLPQEDMRAISALTAGHRRLISPASMAGRWDN